MLDSPLDSVKAESNGGLLGLGIPGTNVWTVTGYKGGQQVVVISEDCGTGGNKAKFQRFCDYSARQACLILLHFIKAKCAISDDIAGQRRASTSVTSALYICTKAGCIAPGAKETAQD